MAICGGGGGSSPAAPYDDSARLAAQAAADKQRNDAFDANEKFNNAMAALTTGGEARQTGVNYLNSQGLDPNTFGYIIDQAIGQAKGKVPNLDPNPANYFGNDLFATAVDQAQSGQRTANNRQVQTTFAPGYENTAIPDTAIDPIVNDVLKSQSDTAGQALDFQRKRGTLNDVGYSTAQQKFGDQSAAARSTLSSLGRNVLGKDRADITSIIGNAGNAANTWSLGMPSFDITPYLGQVQSKAASDTANLGGDLKAALGSTQLFDIPSIVAAGGTAQGPQNLTTEGLPFANPKKQLTQRGLGSTGTF